MKDLKNRTSEQTLLFENPLMQKILTKEDVAMIFRKSLTWVSRMMSCGSLNPHYVGDTAMFHAEEIENAFLSDSLAQRRKLNDQKEKKQGVDNQRRSQSQDRGQSTLSTFRQSSRR
jgi:hypothetical protein